MLICILNQLFWSSTVWYTPVREETILVVIVRDVLLNAVPLYSHTTVKFKLVYTYFNWNVMSHHGLCCKRAFTFLTQRGWTKKHKESKLEQWHFGIVYAFKAFKNLKNINIYTVIIHHDNDKTTGNVSISYKQTGNARSVLYLSIFHLCTDVIKNLNEYKRVHFFFV